MELLTAAHVLVLTNVPDPGRGEAPPGTEGFLEVLAWSKWVALGICVLGLIVAGALMAVNSRRGEGGEHLGRIGMALAGVIVISAAYFLVGALA
ncbi:hypothetical protein GB881_03420 [Georgenia subflava]|uniref:Conjugal transfer protein TrbC n=1 Tax=Georgenia subflava TaxID=1622177 RepID=A0A6N7ECF3_9MICO|nr:hypothetical protein [Georgenia subflava]